MIADVDATGAADATAAAGVIAAAAAAGVIAAAAAAGVIAATAAFHSKSKFGNQKSSIYR